VPRPHFTSLVIVFIASSLLWAQPLPEHPPAGKAKPEPAAPAKAKPADEKLVRTQHVLTLDGKQFEYEATAGTLALRDDEDKVRAHVFFVAYTRTGLEPSKRPLTFAFNGGPGSSSVWLHLGAFGPRRVALAENGRSAAPPYRLVDNDTTLLDLTDLVFIDPVSTGYSRAGNPQEAKHFHSLQGDVESVGSFIRRYLERFGRWNSPKFLAGESYGTTRAAALAEHLQDHEGVYLNGVILISAVLSFQAISGDEGNDLPYPLFLPALTATAWYHKRLPAELQSDLRKTLDEVEKFAARDYAMALMRGDALPADTRKEVARKLARYTGLSEEYVLRSDLRIAASRFRKELLRDQRKTIGRFDSRYEGPDLDAAGDRPGFDPSYAAVQGPFTALVNRYLKGDLKYESDLDYRVLTSRVQPWDFGAKNRYVNVAPALRRALAQNPTLRVFVASGLYDLATPYYATHHTFNHLGPAALSRDRVRLVEYRAGHMMYIEEESRRLLKKDLGTFYRGEAAVPTGGANAPPQRPHCIRQLTVDRVGALSPRQILRPRQSNKSWPVTELGLLFLAM
jgi:carboxypeptidase C (cathepsin A)